MRARNMPTLKQFHDGFLFIRRNFSMEPFSDTLDQDGRKWVLSKLETQQA